MNRSPLSWKFVPVTFSLLSAGSFVPGLIGTAPSSAMADEPARILLAQSTSESDADDESESDAAFAEPQKAADAKPSAKTAAPAKKKSLLVDAYEKTKTAKNEAAYTQIIDQCREGMQADTRESSAAYGRKLLGWAYNRRGEARAAAGRDREAIADFEASIKNDPRHWRAVHNRGVSHAMAGKYREAMADFNRTIDLYQNYPNAYFNRGELRYEHGDLDGALSDYNAALRLAPDDATAYNSRGHTYYRMDRFPQAMADYNRALEIQPENAAVLTNRGDAYADMHQYGDAANDYRQAIRYNPKMGRAYQSAAWLMATCPEEQYRDERLALDAAQKAIELNGDRDYRYLETLAAAEAAAGDFAKAQATQARAIKAAPKSETERLGERLEMYRRSQPYREGTSIASRPGPPRDFDPPANDED